MALNPGDTLVEGRYRIMRQLGQGGFGFVYQAQDTLLGEEVAVKELIPALVGDQAMLNRFLREARATMRLRHRHIVGTHNIFSEGDNYYIVMEYMAGGSLEERLEKGKPLPANEAVRVAAEVGEGLACAHEEGVIHCDLKPHNILFDARGQAKVADFGIAHVSGEMLTRSWNTPAGFVAGTLPYMSPEQAEGVRDDPRLDVYALGAVLFRMLTGRTYLDFDERETPAAQADNVMSIRSQQPVPPSAHAPHIPQWLDGVVLRALAKRPEDRFQTALELHAALSEPPVPPLGPVQVAHSGVEAGPTVLETEEKQRAIGPVPRRISLPVWFWPAVGAAVVLLVVLVVAVAGLRGGMDGDRALAPTAAPGLAPTSQAGGPPPSTATGALRPTTTLAPTSTPRPPTGTPGLATEVPKPETTLRPSNTPSLPPTATSAWSGRIAFGSVKNDDWDIYVMPAPGAQAQVNADGSELTNLTDNPAQDRHPSWSPHGRRIAFTSFRDDNWDIYVIDAGGSELTRLTDSPAADMWPTWSPDGTRIAFMSNRDGNWEIYVMHADGSVLANLTNDTADDRFPAWSPGSRIAFHSDRDGDYEVYAMDASGSGLTRLTHNPASDGSASWSPDGTRIAFHSDRDGNWEVYVMHADGTWPTRLTDNPGLDGHPTWSPDGSHIAFVSQHDGNSEIYVMAANGDDPVRLTGDPAEDERPSWAP